MSSVIFDLRHSARMWASGKYLEAELNTQGPGLMYGWPSCIRPPPPPSVQATGGGSSERSKSWTARGSRSAPPSRRADPVDAGRDTRRLRAAPRGAHGPKGHTSKPCGLPPDVDEVARLVPAGIERGVTASRAIGYAQAIAQLHGRLDERAAIEHVTN